jgi:hypothetical protein
MTAVSRYYKAKLGLLDSSTQESFVAWAQSQSHRHVLTNDDDGQVLLYAEREQSRPAKSHMASLRTSLTQHWKINVQLLPGSLNLLSEEGFHEALANHLPCEPSAEPIESASIRLLSTGFGVEEVLSLSTYFDVRAREMRAALVAA